MPRFCTSALALMIGAAALLAFSLSPAAGQVIGPQEFVTSPPPGVRLDADGQIRVREVDERKELSAMRARVKAAERQGEVDGQLTYLSLPKLLAQAAAGGELSPETKYLGGLTRIRYIFLFPDDHDLVIAGPAEPWKVMNEKGEAIRYAVGQRTGRPVMQLDDLLVALRTAHEGGGRAFGCGIYPPANSLTVAADVSKTMATRSRAERIKAIAERIGPQEVRIFGTPNDTRLAFICVAADYEMKRYAMGLAHSPIAGLGSGVDNSRAAANKFWFETNYQPLRVSPDGLAYELRGQRLAVKAGELDFDPRGATETAERFADRFTQKLPSLAAAVPLFAELQNVADEAMLANLIRRDRLAEKIGWDLNAQLDRTMPHVAKIPVPRTAQTLSGVTAGSLVAGGVTMSFDTEEREQDNEALRAARKEAEIARKK